MATGRLVSFAFLIAGSLALAACSSNEEARATEGEHNREGRGEHGGGEGRGEHGGRESRAEHGGREGGEESGTQFGLGDTYDHTRNGVRLELRFDREGAAFVGTVENTTKARLESVRVEVHLSNGIELGPTEPGDLGPGQKRDVRLAAKGQAFEKWSAHPEVGSGEHGHGSEGEGHR